MLRLGESVTLALNWFFNPNASLQLNYIRADVSQRNVVEGTNVFDDGSAEIVGVRLRFDF